jgi:hypothetical protein
MYAHLLRIYIELEKLEIIVHYKVYKSVTYSRYLACETGKVVPNVAGYELGRKETMLNTVTLRWLWLFCIG